MTGQLDYPFEEVVKGADAVLAKGGMVFFKFTCQRCGDRQTFDVPNTLYETGSCDKCGAITDLTEHGCNFVAVFGKAAQEILAKWGESERAGS
jgi:hypothetical protein